MTVRPPRGGTDYILPELAKRIRLDPKTGALTWLAKPGAGRTVRGWNTKYAGRVVGAPNPDGYVRIGFRLGSRDHLVLAHRLVWFMVIGRAPVGAVDHIDGDPENNRFDNLREVSKSLNGRNATLKSTNTSGVPGVYWHRKNRRWCVQARVDGMKVHLGSFVDKDEAARVSFAFRAANGFTNRNFRGVAI